MGNTNLYTNPHKYRFRFCKEGRRIYTRIDTNVFMGGQLIYKEESFLLTGCAFAVYNEMGYGHHERNYSKAFAIELAEKSIPYKKELCVPVLHKDIQVGKYYLDFLVWNKIVIELKVGNEFYTNHIKQVLTYLHQTNTKLGIIYLFTPNGVEFKRIVK